MNPRTSATMHSNPKRATTVRATSREALSTRNMTGQKPAPPTAGAVGGSEDEFLVRVKGSVTELG
jgi:hypothetical protein